MPSSSRYALVSASPWPDNFLSTVSAESHCQHALSPSRAAIIEPDAGASLKLATTEQRNPRSRGLDRKSTLDILRVLNREDAQVAPAVRRELPKIVRAVDAIVKAFRDGGRLFYVGAGTSGRLAVLDATECPPTFATPPGMVQAIIAGGERALRGAVEDAEDSARAGARDLRRKSVSRRDVVVGLSASGTTPYVLGAIEFARRRGAVTIGITSNLHSPLARRARIRIVPHTGPEAITGSTRLKAGTAQKLVLNLLSTAAMARMGRVYDNWMIHVALTNEKLRQRGARVLEKAAGVGARAGKRALRNAKYDLPTALVMLKARADFRTARQSLATADGNVREALEIAKRRSSKQR